MFYLGRPSLNDPEESTGFYSLIPMRWDDWFEFQTVFRLEYTDSSGDNFTIGSIKIGRIGMKGASSQNEARKWDRTPQLPSNFEELDDDFFSLGQDSSYYQELNDLPDIQRETILKALNDIAYDEEKFQRAIDEKVTSVSLLRTVSVATIEGEFRRLAKGNLIPQEYHFTYVSSITTKPNPFELKFDVVPKSYPPSNINVLIGRNGVGKTHLLNAMMNAVVRGRTARSKYGRFQSDYTYDKLFANVVSVTFSAFDNFDLIPEKKDKSTGVNFSHIGLKRIVKSTGKVVTKTHANLRKEFVDSLKFCIQNSIKSRWVRAIEVLKSDPIFGSSGVSDLINENPEGEDFNEKCAFLFDKFSSGHKIVLLSLTQLVGKITARSLVLIDEPEAHLHPPLLAAFIRALSDLLYNRNGVAIIATHSPVVLQEVPKKCAWRIDRTGAIVNVNEINKESFGENVGSLTSDVFGLEVTHSGFYKILRDFVDEGKEYDEILHEFNNEIGFEGQAILRSLIYTRDNEEN